MSGWPASTCGPALGERKVAALRPMELDTLYAELRGFGPVGPDGADLPHRGAPVARAGPQVGADRRSPAVDATPPPQTRKAVTPPTVAEVQLLLSAARDDDPEFGAYLWVLAATGCRRGEGCGLRWSDIDLDGEELVIRRAIAMANGVPYEKSTKTHASRRVSLDEATVLVLREHRRRMLERAMALGVRLADDAYVFADVEGRPWRPDVCTNRFGRLRAQLGLDRVRLHDLRHFVATALGDGGSPDRHDQLPPRPPRHRHDPEHLHPRPPRHRQGRRRLPRRPAVPEVRPIELLLLGAELEAALGVRVDIGTRQTLSEGLRDEVLAESVPL
jgi:hypothetical protein